MRSGVPSPFSSMAPSRTDARNSPRALAALRHPSSASFLAPSPSPSPARSIPFATRSATRTRTPSRSPFVGGRVATKIGVEPSVAQRHTPSDAMTCRRT
jgi:hypothetical protein